jgi:hypothetical protein
MHRFIYTKKAGQINVSERYYRYHNVSTVCPLAQEQPMRKMYFTRFRVSHPSLILKIDFKFKIL